MFFAPLGGAEQRITRNGAGFAAGPIVSARLPAGHPEGYLEGFGALYAGIADVLSGQDAGQADHLPGIADGLRGMEFINAAIESGKAGAAWIGF